MFYRNKKGFTLIEIIVCIAIIAVIATVSIVGINYISKSIKLNRLKDIQDEIMTAAQIYLETNNEINQRIYDAKEGVIVPLKVLVNEGLLDLSTTELDMDDINGEYVVAALSTVTSSGSEPCVDLKALTSWDEESDRKIYLCSKSDGTVSIQGSGLSANNLSVVTREPIDFSNEYRYVIYNNIKYRLLRLDSDDSLTIMNWGSFGDIFKGKVLPMMDDFDYINYNFDVGTWAFSDKYLHSYSSNVPSPIQKMINNEEQLYKGVTVRPVSDIATSYYYLCTNVVSDANPNNCVQSFSISTEYAEFRIVYRFGEEYFVSTKSLFNGERDDYSLNVTDDDEVFKLKKITLKPCMKIVGGSGTFANPYEITDTCG